MSRDEEYITGEPAQSEAANSATFELVESLMSAHTEPECIMVFNGRIAEEPIDHQMTEDRIIELSDDRWRVREVDEPSQGNPVTTYFEDCEMKGRCMHEQDLITGKVTCTALVNLGLEEVEMLDPDQNTERQDTAVSQEEESHNTISSNGTRRSMRRTEKPIS